MNLTKSKYLYYEMNQENKKVYYHALFGNVRLVEENNEQLLDFFEETRSIEELYEQLKITEEEKQVVDEIIGDYIEAFYLVEDDCDERNILVENNNEYIEKIMREFPFEFIGFSITDMCNFACKYCIAGANSVKTSYCNYDKEKLKKYIFDFSEELVEKGKKKLGIGFTGGEPLLRWEDIKSVIAEVHKKYAKYLEITVYINTNASLITNEIAKFFKDYNVRPSTSLDGVENWNDKVRIYKNGNSTFEDILRGIRILRDYQVECEGFYLTLTKDNFIFDVQELFNFAKDNNFSNITIEPDLINVLDIDVDEICTKLIECYKTGMKQNIRVTGFWKRPFNNMRSFDPLKNGFCRALDSKSIVIDKEGYVSPCGYSKLRISKLSSYQDLVNNEEYVAFIRNNLRGNIEKCRGCKIEGVCKGGCLISREVNQENDRVFKYRCEIYIKMTELLLKEAKYGA